MKLWCLKKPYDCIPITCFIKRFMTEMLDVKRNGLNANIITKISIKLAIGHANEFYSRLIL